MHRMTSLAAATILVLAALYLLVLGAIALRRPDLATRFLGGFAATARLHFTELGLRVLTGSAMILYAPRMAWGQLITGFGWILVGTSIALALVPWRIHRQFASRTVPRAMRFLTLIGLVAMAGGLWLLAALVLPYLSR